MSELLKAFKAACDAFNNARNVNNYNDVRRYLADYVEMQKVDDPSSIKGNQDAIIDYLKTSQAQTGYWPQLKYGTPDPEKEHKGIGNITGTGEYQDKYNDPTTVKVRYAFRFRKDGGGGWLLASANATPIP